MRPRRLLFAAVVVALAACGGDEPATSAAPAAEPTPAPVAEATPAPSPTPAATPAPPAEPATPNRADQRAAMAQEPPIPMITALPDPATIGDTPKGLANGAFAPELAHLDMRTGKPFKLSDITGPTAEAPAKAVIVGFTASWCGPCKQSYPYLQKMQEEHEGLKVVLVTTDATVDAKAKHVEVVSGTPLEAPLLDPSPDTLRAWLGRKRNVPHFYVINQVGEILVQDRGFGDKVRRVMPGQIRFALNNPEYVRRR